MTMNVYIREKKGYLYLDSYYQGRRLWESLGIKVKDVTPQEKKYNLKLAEKIRFERHKEYNDNIHGFMDMSKSRISVLDYAKEMAKNKNKKDALPKSLKYLQGYAKGIQLKAINEKWLSGYVDFLHEQDNINPSTIVKYFGALNQVLNQAERERLINYNPAKHIEKPKAPKPKPKYLTITDLQKLVNTKMKTELGKEIRRSFLFATRTGLRKGDLITLKWKHIQLEDKTLYKEQGKTKNMVFIYLDDFALSLISDGEEHKGDDLVFPLLSRSKTNLNQYLNTWHEAAGVKHFGWHIARHTCATHLINNGASVEAVMEFLGHTKIQTTMIYAHLFDSTKKETILALPKLKY